ncbi:MAG TPA: methionine--tRNA ligase subunit beta, partial [Vicinamibacterales bacterium]|nr:methionine--tRNA ligase subunit beta [Vicinamibacterales bacterium]
SVSRAGQAWGVPLPFDPQSVAYVWFDALINYAAAVGLGHDAALFEKWWPADLHVIGKDITRFHAVIWPAMLMAANLPLPKQVFGHGFMTIGGQRMSKSNPGTIIDPAEAAARHGADALRLYLTKEVSFGGDGDFSWERFDERYNVDLANNLGNLVSRVTAMAHRYNGGVLRTTGATAGQLARLGDEVVGSYRSAMDRWATHEGVAAAFRLIDGTNEFIAQQAPWTLAKDPANRDRVTQILFDAAEAVRLAAVLLSPVIPASSAEILRRIGAGDAAPVLDRDGRWRTDGDRRLSQDGPLWPRKEQSIVSEPPRDSANSVPPPPVPGAAASASSTPAPAPAGDSRISIDDFMKVELRVAKVLAAERVPKSKKLLKLSVDVGTEQRTIVAGLAEAYEPEAMIGRTVVIVFNLKPATLMGVESNGMVLAGSPEGGKPELVTFAEPPPPGSRVR